MIDWVSWVLIALMLFFFGKQEYSRSQLDSYKEHNLDKSKDGHASEYFQQEQNKYMAYFALVFLIFILRESFIYG
jgi:high-affinity Fe2+/Pb2+ permease